MIVVALLFLVLAALCVYTAFQTCSWGMRGAYGVLSRGESPPAPSKAQMAANEKAMWERVMREHKAKEYQS